MVQAVNVPGVGVVNFPDGMSPQDMASAIQKNFPQIHAPPAAAPPQQQPPSWSQLANQAMTSQMSLGQLTSSSGAELEKNAAANNAGMAAGLRNVGGNLKQLGADVSDFWNTQVTGQMDANTGQLIRPNTGDTATYLENQRRAAADQAAQQKYGQNAFAGPYKFAENASETTAEQLPMLVAGGGMDLLAGPPETYLGNLFKQTALGSVNGASLYSPSNDRGRDTYVGGGGAFGIGLALGIPQGILNYVARGIAAGGTRNEVRYQNAKDVMGWGQGGDADPTLGQRYGSPYARTMEDQGFNGGLQNYYANVAQRFSDRFRRLFDLGPVPGLRFDAAFASAKQGAQNTLDALKSAAMQNYERGMARANELDQQILNPEENYPRGPMTFQHGVDQTKAVGQGPPQGARIDASDLSQQLAVQRARQADPIERGGLSKPMMDLLDDWTDTLKKQGGKFTVAQTASALRRLTQVTNDGGADAAYAYDLRKAFDRDLDRIGDGSQADAAVRQVLETRRQYKANMQDITNRSQSAAYQMLGVGSDAQVDAGKMLNTFRGFERDKQTQVVSYLTDHAPEVLQLMRRKVMNEAMTALIKNTGPGTNSMIRPDALVTSLFGENGGELLTTPLWSPSERANLYAFKDAAHIIGNAAEPGAKGITTVVGAAEAVPNMISRNAIFVGRHLARFLTASNAADIFTDPEFANMVRTIKRTDGTTQLAARIQLTKYLQSHYGTPPAAADSQQSQPAQGGAAVAAP